MLAPTDDALQAVLHKIITRMLQLITRRGRALVEEQGSTCMGDTDADSDDARTAQATAGRRVYIPHRQRLSAPARRC